MHIPLPRVFRDSNRVLTSRLTLALSGGAPKLGARRGRTIYPGARGAHAATYHRPLERVVRRHRQP